MANISGENLRREGWLPFQADFRPRWKPFQRPEGIRPKWAITALDGLEIEPLFLRPSALRWAILPQTSKARLLSPDPKRTENCDDPST